MKELTPEQIRMQQDGMKKICSLSDVIITTAQVFGRPAPRIITQEMIDAMQPGSVIVDMAVATGGNVEGSEIDSIQNIDGVKVIGYSNLPSFVANHASFALSNNLVNFVTDFYDQDKKSMSLDINDEIIKSATLVKNGEIKEGF